MFAVASKVLASQAERHSSFGRTVALESGLLHFIATFINMQSHYVFSDQPFCRVNVLSLLLRVSLFLHVLLFSSANLFKLLSPFLLSPSLISKPQSLYAAGPQLCVGDCVCEHMCVCVAFSGTLLPVSGAHCTQKT